jgi:prolyl-tRNA synthetase
MVMGATHEEVVTFLVRGELKSYRQIPLNLYQIQVKFRDEIRPRFGLMRGREFIMKDAYTFDPDEESHKVSYQKMVDAYFAIFKRAGVESRKVESDTGAMGGNAAHEFMLIVDTAGGEEMIFFCDKCDYAANIEKATSRETNPPNVDNELLEIKEVPTPNAATIEEVTSFLNVESIRLAKTLIYLADGKPVAAMIRGDRELNMIKLKNHLGAIELEMAPAAVVEEITGCQVGFAGPIGLKNIPLVADNEITKMKNFIVGANKDEVHILNVNLERDFRATSVSDIINAEEGELCPVCDSGSLHLKKGIEMGNTFMLGTKYSESMGATFLDDDGKEKPFIMGSYGIGITRTPQAAIEKYHDERGIVWPKSIAPYQVIILPLNYATEEHKGVSQEIYKALSKADIDCLLDNRTERAGVKFNDADLIGIPIQVIIGDKSLKMGKIELKSRQTGEKILIETANVVDNVKSLLDKMN